MCKKKSQITPELSKHVSYKLLTYIHSHNMKWKIKAIYCVYMMYLLVSIFIYYIKISIAT